MPVTYAQTTLGSLTDQLGQVLDDTTAVYWTTAEKVLAIQEAMRVWGALTNYWRARGTFSLTPGQADYDLSATLPRLRPRVVTLNQIVTEIQYMLLEPPSGIAGSGMSGQVSIASILQSVQRARNRFVLDAHFPYSTREASSDTDGFVALPAATALVHRAAWLDTTTRLWTNLWRQDAWAVDRSDPLWLQFPGPPLVYSMSQLAPLSLQLSPVPLANGTISMVTVDSLNMDLTNPAALPNVPDEWVHAIKYAALEDLLNADSQLNDPLRAKYAGMRYDQAVMAAQKARTATRVLLNNTVLPLDSLTAIDAAWPVWRNQLGRPSVAGVVYDLLYFVAPPDLPYGAAVDVVQAAPIPQFPGDFIQIGYEDLGHILDYCTHILLFKCGGTEFQSGFTDYDAFMKAVEGRGLITGAQVIYTDAVFGQPQKEQRERPDALKPKAAA